MEIDKDLALVYSFETAPEELKIETEAFKNAWLRLEKAKDQMKKWTNEFQKAQADYAKQSKKFKKAVEAWDPAQINNHDLIER